MFVGDTHKYIFFLNIVFNILYIMLSVLELNQLFNILIVLTIVYMF